MSKSKSNLEYVLNSIEKKIDELLTEHSNRKRGLTLPFRGWGTPKDLGYFFSR